MTSMIKMDCEGRNRNDHKVDRGARTKEYEVKHHHPKNGLSALGAVSRFVW